MATIDTSLEINFRFDPTTAKQNIKAELFQFCEEVMAASKQIVPVDTGTLMSSGHVQLPEETGNTISVTMGYGGPASGYALVVHENLDPRVHWKRPGSGPKYLENPMKERQGDLPGRIGEALKNSIG